MSHSQTGRDEPGSAALSQTSSYIEFTANSYPLRIHAGTGALQRLPAELTRHSMRRVLILCGRSVRASSSLIDHLEALCGDRHALTFDAIPQGAPRSTVEAAVAEARRAGADGIVAVGAGTVTKAARVIAILLAETGPIADLATQYPVGQPAISPRLEKPKYPIINIVTAATTSQSRAGASIHDPENGHQWEFYDPKTRARAVFWDPEALATAPASLTRSSAAWLYWRALMSMGALHNANPLVRADRAQGFALVQQAITALTLRDAPRARIDLCAVALLQMRDEDDGGRPMSAHLIVRAIYVLAVALFNLKEIGQTTAAIALSAAALREFGPACPEVIDDLAAALGLASPHGGLEAVAQALEERFSHFGWATNLQGFGIGQSDETPLLEYALHNHNGNHDRQMDARIEGLRRVLQRASS